MGAQSLRAHRQRRREGPPGSLRLPPTNSARHVGWQRGAPLPRKQDGVLRPPSSTFPPTPDNSQGHTPHNHGGGVHSTRSTSWAAHHAPHSSNPPPPACSHSLQPEKGVVTHREVQSTEANVDAANDDIPGRHHVRVEGQALRGVDAPIQDSHTDGLHEGKGRGAERQCGGRKRTRQGGDARCEVGLCGRGAGRGGGLGAIFTRRRVGARGSRHRDSSPR